MDWTTDPPERGVMYSFTRPARVGGPLDRTERMPTYPAFWHPESNWSKAVLAGWWRAGVGSELKGPVPTNAYAPFPKYPMPAPPEVFDEAVPLFSGKAQALECDGCGGGGTAIEVSGGAMAECHKCEGFGILFQTHEFGACSVTRIRELAARRRR